MCGAVLRAHSWVTALCRLREVPNNYYRLLRVLEIVQRTGRRMSELDIDEVRSIAAASGDPEYTRTQCN